MHRNDSIPMPLRIIYFFFKYYLLANECGANQPVPVMLQLQFYQIQICISNRLDAVWLGVYQNHGLCIGCLDQWRRQIVCVDHMWARSMLAQLCKKANVIHICYNIVPLRPLKYTHTQYLKITNTITWHFTEYTFFFSFSCECCFHSISTECL